MILLGLVSSAKVASVCLYQDGRILDESYSNEQRRHSETLLPLVDAMLTGHDLAIEQVDCFAVDIGPGSFTGVRIGTASINAMAAALGKPVIGVTALDAIYEEAGCPANAVIVLDAGGGRIYYEVYEDGLLTVSPKRGNREELTAYDSNTYLLLENREPKASGLIQAALKRMDAKTRTALPVYLAVTQAERLYDERHPEGRA